MSTIQTIEMNQENMTNTEGYKVIEVNVENPVEDIYAVCTPVKQQ